MLISFARAWKHLHTQEAHKPWNSQTSWVLSNLWEDSELHPGKGWYPRVVLTSARTSRLGGQPDQCAKAASESQQELGMKAMHMCPPDPKSLKKNPVGKASGIQRMEKRGSSLRPDRERCT